MKVVVSSLEGADQPMATVEGTVGAVSIREIRASVPETCNFLLKGHSLGDELVRP